MNKLILFFLLISVNFAYAQTIDELYLSSKEAYKNKEYKQALKTVDKALKIDGSNYDCLMLKINTLDKLEKYMDSYELIEKTIIQHPNKSALYNNRGVKFILFKVFDKAITDFNVAVNLSENDSLKIIYLCNRSQAKTFNRDFNGAYIDLHQAYQYDSLNLEVLIYLGAACEEIGKGDDALKYLLKAIEIDSMYMDAYNNLGYKYQLMGEYEKSIEYINKVLKHNPKDAIAYNNRSYSKLKIKDLKGAMEDVEMSITLYPGNPYVYRNRALIYIEMGKMDKACKDLQKAIDLGFTMIYGDEVKQLQQKYCK